MSDVGEARSESTLVEYADVFVRIPTHSSALSHPCVREGLFCQQPPSEFTNRSRHHDGFSDESKPSVDTTAVSSSSVLSPRALHLELRCHHPGVLWRGLLPMLFAPLGENTGELMDGQGYSNPETNRSSSSSRKRNRCTKATALPQQVLMGLGLKDAVQRFRKTMFHQRRDINTTVLLDDPTNDDQLGHDLFYELRARFPFTLTPTRSESNMSSNKDTGNDDRKGSDNISGACKVKIVLWIFPPLTPPSDIDRTPFAGIVSRIQRVISMQNGWNAWLSTLGGGYFGIKNLQKSLWLAQQQRNLALWLGDTKMARQCTLNEAYNWMYSGRFRLAGSVLGKLENEVTETKRPHSDKEDKIFLQRCSAARVFLRRLKKLSQKGLGKYHQVIHHEQRQSRVIRTNDEFHRFRIVSC